MGMKTLFDNLKYALYLIVHPFKGFWELKRERKDTLKPAMVILGLVIVMYITRRQYTGFLLNDNDVSKLNIFVEIISVVLPFFLWCVSNWCLTTLMDGEGRLSDIISASAYSLTPLVIINFPLVIMSLFITQDESAFYYFFDSLAVVWSGALMVIGTMVTHGYTMLRTLLTVLFIIVGMGIMIFIGLLFFNVCQEMYLFVLTIFREITFR